MARHLLIFVQYHYECISLTTRPYTLNTFGCGETKIASILAAAGQVSYR